MTNTIITIGREFGSGGCEIGHKLAEKLGISIIHQELSVLPNLTVAENLFLGNEKIKNKNLSEASGLGGVLLSGEPGIGKSVFIVLTMVPAWVSLMGIALDRIRS